METTTELRPGAGGRFASLLAPEVAVRLDQAAGAWRAEVTEPAPPRGLVKARLTRSAYAVGELLEDGTLGVLWQWDVEDDVVLDDEAVPT